MIGKRFGFIPLILVLATSVAEAEITAEAVRDAIRRGVGFLKSAQDVHSGGWTEYRGQEGGVTALCTLALVSSGVPADDPAVQRALNYLRRLGNPESTYSTSLQTMVFCYASPDQDRLLIRQNVEWLEEAQIKSGPGEGGWTYKSTYTSSGSPDNSNSQFALLALYEANRIGVHVKAETWQRAANYWARNQLSDGSWGYRGNHGTGSMTCAGIASMLIATRSLIQGDAWVVDGRVVCCRAQDDQQPVQKGLHWMARHFSVTRNPTADPRHNLTWLFYYLYGLERVGRMSGQRFIGQHDWYREGAEMFVAVQDTLTGAWPGTPPLLGRREIDTAMALLFLSKGNWPVLVSKLKHSQSNDWDRHRNDLGNLARYVEQRWKRNLTWQVIDIKNATVADLLQTPVLFISGKDGLRLSAQEKQLLRDYVNQGGFIFAEACCNSSRFDSQFRKVLEELFPDSPLRLLPADHAVWFAEQPVHPDFMRPLYGLDTCCRTGVVYCPENLGCYWELARGPELPYPISIQTEVRNVLAIGANVLAYATGRELRDKLDVPAVVDAEDEGDALRRGTLQVAKLQHGGGSDDAPAALANLLGILRDQLELPVTIQRRLLPATDGTLAEYPLVYIHGRREFQFSAEERTAIARYIENGGVIFGDAICASEAFAAAFRREMQAIFPDRSLKRIPNAHPLFTSEYRGFDLSQVGLRQPVARNEEGPLTARVQQIAPVLEGIEFDGQYSIIFSPYDISCALENSASMDCLGYTREDAARIGINVILYALQE
jgi:hypothetical protein